MRNRTAVMVMVFATMVGVLGGVLALALAQSPDDAEQPPGPTGQQAMELTVALAADGVYTHTDSDNPLTVALANSGVCRAGAAVSEWRSGSSDYLDDGWNGLRLYRVSSTDWKLVGSPVASNVSARWSMSASCRTIVGNHRASGRSIRVTLSVSGDLPAHRASESIYHGHHHSDGKHPDAAHVEHEHAMGDYVPRTAYDALLADLGEAQCLALEPLLNVHTHWDATRSAPTLPLNARSQLDYVIASQRNHCCIASGNKVSADDCFDPPAPATPAVQPDDASDAPEGGASGS